jgi:hypothetical protein
MKIRIVVVISFLAFFLSNLGAAPIELVSKPFESRPDSFGDSSDLEFSADGKWAVFTSNGSGLTTNTVGDFTLNVFLKNLETGETTLLSASPETGRVGGNQHSFGATITADGRFVVFETEADNLVDDDSNEGSDVVIYDRTTGTLSVLSGTTNGVAEGSSGAATITANGRFVLFESDAPDFSALDGNDSVDLYLLDRQSGETKLVTVNASGTAAAAAVAPTYSIGTYEATTSGDGRYVAFVSVATNYVTGVPGNAPAQLYLRDMVAGTNAWLSRSSSGTPSAFVSTPVVSSNGAYVAFLSANLEGTSTLTETFLYIYDTQLGTRTAVQSTGGIRPGVSEFSISQNSAFIAYSASNQVYLYKISDGTTQLASAAAGGAPASGVAASPQISDDGRYVVFVSSATNLAAGASTDVFQTYRFDAQTGETVLLSRAADSSGGANSDTHFPVVSGNGSVAGFMSYASNLVTNDNVTVNDVFFVSTSGTNAVALVSTPHPSAVSSTPAGSSGLEGPALSADGQRLVFTSTAANITPNDTNDARDIFLADLQTGATRLVSLGTNGAPLPGPSSLLGISRSASQIAFASSNVVNGTNARSIFVYDANAESTKIGSVLPTGEISLTVHDGALSQDGRYLAFRTTAQSPIQVRDLENETTVAVTVPLLPSATQILGFSPDGKYLVVRGGSASYSILNWKSNQVVLGIPTSTSGYLTNAFSANDSVFLTTIRVAPSDNLHLYRLDTGTNATLVATNVGMAAVSADGSTIAYQARTNTTSADYNLFTYDLSTGISSPMQIAGTNALFRMRGPLSISADGRFVAFATTNALTAAVVGEFTDIYVYDRILKTTVLASERLSATERTAGATGPLLSADGRLVAFDTIAPDLVPNDRNSNSDVFVRRFTAVDSDADGMEDGWEIAQFGNLNATADADADSDGISNRTEFRAGTDPQSAESKFELATELDDENASLLLTASASPGRTYQLQHRAALGAGDWQDIGEAQVAFSNEVSFEAPIALQGNGFFRVKAVE